MAANVAKEEGEEDEDVPLADEEGDMRDVPWPLLLPLVVVLLL